ncbi:MAG TPA: phosphotransferase, partial [Candidatus Limnocylindrales bacterium]
MDLEQIAERLGSRLEQAEPAGWGDARATQRLSLSDGRRFAARRFGGTEAGPLARRIAAIMAGLARAGLPVQPSTVVETDRATWLLTAWIDGETGAGWLDEPDRARQLAERMGRLALRLRAVDPAGLGLAGSGLVISLVLAVMADHVVRGALAYKTLLIWPYAVAPAIGAVLWSFMFNPTIGILAYGMKLL